MKKIILLILTFNILLSANCEVGSLKEDCDLSGYTNSEDDLYQKDFETYTEILNFKENELEEINHYKIINDIMDYDTNDMVEGEGEAMVEEEATLEILDKTGQYSHSYKTSAEALTYLERKIDIIKNNEGKLQLVNYFTSGKNIAAKITTCEYTIVKSECKTCNYLQGTSIGENTCRVQTIISKNKGNS